MIELTAMMRMEGNSPTKLLNTISYEPLYLNPDYIIGISPYNTIVDCEVVNGSWVSVANKMTRAVKESPQEILELLKKEKQENAK